MVTTKAYDALGRVFQETAPANLGSIGPMTTYGYDVLNAYSGEADQRFQSKPITRSGRSRSVGPALVMATSLASCNAEVMESMSARFANNGLTTAGTPVLRITGSGGGASTYFGAGTIPGP